MMMMKELNNTNVFNARYATFQDVGTLVITDGSEVLIAKLKNTIEAVILVFRAYGNYKAWCKEHGLNLSDKTFKAFYDLVINSDWKTEQDKNIATAKTWLKITRNIQFFTRRCSVSKQNKLDTVNIVNVK